jgi:chromosomal replication initiation ATPase DnaA
MKNLTLANHILQLVAEKTGVTVTEITSNRRTAKIASARQISMWLMRWNTSLSMQSIARLHGKTNHGTVIWASSQVEDLMHIDSNFRNFCKQLKETIK